MLHKVSVSVSAYVSDLEDERDSDSLAEFNAVMVESSLLSESQVSEHYHRDITSLRIPNFHLVKIFHALNIPKNVTSRLTNF